jgi:hypothetical protein
MSEKTTIPPFKRKSPPDEWRRLANCASGRLRSNFDKVRRDGAYYLLPDAIAAADKIDELADALERLKIEYDEVRFNRAHTKDSPQHGDDITLCGHDCEGR